MTKPSDVDVDAELERISTKRKERETADKPQADPSRIEATTWRWIDPAKIPRRAWLYGTSVIRKFLTAIVAPGGSGKSSLVIAELLEMVSGKPLLTGRTGQAAARLVSQH